jgi:hypothetical protein
MEFIAPMTNGARTFLSANSHRREINAKADRNVGAPLLMRWLLTLDGKR